MSTDRLVVDSPIVDVRISGSNSTMNLSKDGIVGLTRNFTKVAGIPGTLRGPTKKWPGFKLTL